MGNPNTGKSTLFSAVTGANQTIGNWSGVTVEKKSGYFDQDDVRYEVVDLPGIYSLTTYSLDEEIARNYIYQSSLDLIINILDVMNLERNLFLTLQLLQFRKPMIICLNMIDIAEKTGLFIDLPELSRLLGCPVVSISAAKKNGIDFLRKSVVEVVNKPSISNIQIPFHPAVEAELQTLIPLVKDQANLSSCKADWYALQLLENDSLIFSKASDIEKDFAATGRDSIYRQTNTLPESLIAEGIYAFIRNVCQKTLNFSDKSREHISDKIDQMMLLPYVGIPLFFLVMFCMFTLSMGLSKPLIHYIEVFFDVVFVKGIFSFLISVNMPQWVILIWSEGICGGGLTLACLIFPILIIYLFISLIEESGYMARVSFIMDRFMNLFGMSGKSIIPMIIGFGCTVPAVLACRTLCNKRDRLLTVLLVPFVSCGAKIPVYVMFTLFFFPKYSGLVLFSLYVFGIVMAFVTAQLFKRLSFRGNPSEFVMELPAYRIPAIKSLFISAYNRTKMFILRAGKTIFVVIFLFSIINAFPIKTDKETGETKTLLTLTGQVITPIFKPIGVEKENWQASVGLVAGLFAKEAIVGAFLSTGTENNEGNGLGNFCSIPQVIAYLLFVLLYTPCVVVFITVYNEAGLFYASLQAVYQLVLAYAVAFLFYHVATYILL
ncbi:MAG: ferrous iron transport protein B [Candidatus Cloacimonetes bacterium]|nr:ferrous iron transport protein B [Candidatus Cloacimonadota bacterium]